MPHATQERDRCVEDLQAEVQARNNRTGELRRQLEVSEVDVTEMPNATCHTGERQVC